MSLLDLFCGAGGAAVGFARAGFTEIDHEAAAAALYDMTIGDGDPEWEDLPEGNDKKFYRLAWSNALAAARAYVNPQITEIWWCLPHHAERPDDQELCGFAWAAGSVDETCRFVRATLAKGEDIQ